MSMAKRSVIWLGSLFIHCILLTDRWRKTLFTSYSLPTAFASAASQQAVKVLQLMPV